MRFYFDPLDRACKSCTGAVARASEITFNVFQEAGGEETFSADACRFVLFRDACAPEYYPMKETKFGWTLTLKINETGLYFYYFDLGTALLGCGKLRRAEPMPDVRPWQITVYDEEYSTPDWFKGGVMYQIFPDRFYKAGNCPTASEKILRNDWGGQPSFRPNERGKVLNNDFFGGNLNGVTEKLDYLESLNVSVIYFNPIFEAYSNHRYDTGDYMKIDPLLGTTEDFERLVLEAKKRGIRVILDGVFNHTGDNSRYFNKYGKYDSVGAYQSQSSPYADWYTFRQFPNDYESWWGIDVLPAINEKSPSYREFICGEDGVLCKWLRCGIGGYRLDVADELPGFFLQEIRRAVKNENPEAIIIGEVWEDASNKISYDVRRQYLQGFELDSVMNYPLKDAILNFMRTRTATMLRETIAMLMDNYPKATLDVLMNILGTHDTPRVLTVLGGKECADKEQMAVTALSEEEKSAALKALRLAAVLQYTLPGVPCVYYGDEIGMEGYLDPFCRGCFTWDNIDEALNAFYQKLGEIRTKRLAEVFQDGEYREVFSDGGCLVFERKKGEHAAYIYVNNSAAKYNIALSGKYEEFLSGETVQENLLIDAFSCGILAKKK